MVDEFPKELERSEQEADEMAALREEMARAENNGEGSNPPGPSRPSGPSPPSDPSGPSGPLPPSGPSGPLPPSGPSEGGGSSHSSMI